MQEFNKCTMSLFCGRQLVLQAIISPLLRHRFNPITLCADHPSPRNYLQYFSRLILQRSCHSETQLEESKRKWTTEFVDSALEKIRSEDKTFYSVSLKEVMKKLQCLSSANISADQIANLMKESPHFLKGKNMEPILKVLQDQGFEGSGIYEILLSFGRITDEDPTELSALLVFLRSIYRTDRKFTRVVTTHPEVLSLIPAKINARVNTLQELFKSDDVLELTIMSPHIIFEDMVTIQDKFDYVFHTMGISQRQMMYSNMFNYSLLHIQTRHVFLERAGFYKKIKKEKGEINSNPLLQDILGLGDKVFAKKFGKMTEQDYKTFAKYFAQEVETYME